MKRCLFILIPVLAVAGALALWFARHAAPPAPVRPYAASPYAPAIDAGLGYLLRIEEHSLPSWQVYALLDYLQRRFRLDEKYRIKKVFPKALWPDYDLAMIEMFGRLIDAGHVPEEGLMEKEENWLVRFMAQALYCDSGPVDDAFLAAMLEKYREDLARPEPGYIATHVVLCCQWLREQGCDRAFPELERQWPEFAGTLVRIIEREQAATDLAFEAMMLLYYTGFGDRVKQEWIETFLSLQRSTGAWGYRPGDADHGHPTALALWVLLERACPDAPKPPWIE